MTGLGGRGSAQPSAGTHFQPLKKLAPKDSEREDDELNKRSSIRRYREKVRKYSRESRQIERYT